MDGGTPDDEEVIDAAAKITDFAQSLGISPAQGMRAMLTAAARIQLALGQLPYGIDIDVFTSGGGVNITANFTEMAGLPVGELH